MSNKVQINMIIIVKSITVIRDTITTTATIIIIESLIIRNTKTMTKNPMNNTPNVENIRIIITTSVTIQDTQNSDL